MVPCQKEDKIKAICGEIDSLKREVFNGETGLIVKAKGNRDDINSFKTYVKILMWIIVILIGIETSIQGIIYEKIDQHIAATSGQTKTPSSAPAQPLSRSGLIPSWSIAGSGVMK
jgi:hypothetical protein